MSNKLVIERRRAGHGLFRFGIETCLLTRSTGHGDFAPQHTTWRDPAG